MEKRIIIIGLAMFILSINLINAGLGISPGRVIIDFKPNSSYLINYQVLFADPEQKLMVSAVGDFADYVKFDKKVFNGTEVFTAYIDFPSQYDSPGKKKLGISIREYSENNNGGIGISLEVIGSVIIKVPYPGKYGEIDSFSASDTNENESFSINLQLSNLGTEDIEPDVDFEIYSKDKLLDKYPVGSKLVQAGTIGVFEKTIDKNKYLAGNYDVFAYVHINDDKSTILKANTTLRVGTLFVDIINWTKEINKSKINQFNIEIESNWNYNLKNVYAQINVTNETGQQADFFKTSPVELNRWEKAILTGYINAENLKEGDYKANITLFYEEAVTNKEVDIKVVIPEVPRSEGKEINYFMIIGIIIAGVILAAIIIIIYMIRKNGKNGKKVKSRK